MKKYRAIYTGDVRFDECPVFELNTGSGFYEMLKDKEFCYPKECVEEDQDFILFEVENDEARLINLDNKRRL